MLKFEIKNEKIVVTFFSIKFSLKIDKLLKIVSLFDYILPKKKNRVCFLLVHEYINACSMYLKYLEKEHDGEFEFVNIVTNSKDIKNFKNSYSKFNIKGIVKALKSKYIIVPSYDLLTCIFASKKHQYLFFNHGMPLKTIGLAQKCSNKLGFMQRSEFLGKNAKFFVTSDMFKVSTIACFSCNYHSVFVTGSPRNDTIGSSTNDEKLKQMFNFEKYSKTVLYMPTYMKMKDQEATQAGKEFNNIFYLDDYVSSDFVKTIEENNILFIMKPHPSEEYFYKETPDVLPKSENFKIIFNEDFYSRNIEQYELFKFIDCMVSDYSSSPVDYLILNKPVIYLNSLAKDYNLTRGMVLEDNFEFLMPGVKVTTYADFEKALIDALTVDSFKQKREELLPLIHKYRDFNSCDRIYKVMRELK